MVSPFDRHRVPGVSPGGRGLRRLVDGTDAASSGFAQHLAGTHAPRQAPFSSPPLNPYIVANRRPAINGFLGYATVIWAARMLNDVYNRRILELAGTIPRIGRLDQPDASATAHSKLCGSTVSVDLKMDGDTVADFAHEVKACALGQASSSIMARNVVGANADELRSLREAVRKMLKENGAPPAEGKWADIAVLEPVRDYKARHASTMLTFDAVVDAINQIEAKRAAQPAK
jgi:NifU-like protein involved in Fe-S cluster formation